MGFDTYLIVVNDPGHDECDREMKGKGRTKEDEREIMLNHRRRQIKETSLQKKKGQRKRRIHSFRGTHGNAAGAHLKATDTKVSSTPLQRRRRVPLLFKKHQSDPSFKSLPPCCSLQVRRNQREEESVQLSSWED